MNTLDTTSLKPGDEVAVKTDRYGRITPATWPPSMSRPKGQAGPDQHEPAEATC